MNKRGGKPFVGLVGDYIQAERIRVLKLKGHSVTERYQGKKVHFTEWRDNMGNLYFYSIEAIAPNYVTSREVRESQRREREIWRS